MTTVKRLRQRLVRCRTNAGRDRAIREEILCLSDCLAVLEDEDPELEWVQTSLPSWPVEASWRSRDWSGRDVWAWDMREAGEAGEAIVAYPGYEFRLVSARLVDGRVVPAIVAAVGDAAAADAADAADEWGSP